MSRKQKIVELLRLQSIGAIVGLCPVANATGGTAYWHYRVLEPDQLSDPLFAEFAQLGELRW